MRQNQLIRQVLTPLKRTPLHPQWFVFKDELAGLREIAAQTHGVVLDIGAGEQKIQAYLPAGTTYLSLDYYQTATAWYGTRPCLFATAQQLPIATASIDTVLLLDVLEHLPRPEQAIAEIWRVLRPGGTFILQIPFLYPLHDTPYDFHRWTEHGLHTLATTYQFTQLSATHWGHPLETAALLTNLALTHTILRWAEQKNPLLITTPLLLPLLPLGNSMAWLLARLSPRNGFMPHSYRMVWRKASG
jgi:SAM-dependent methyltransferase